MNQIILYADDYDYDVWEQYCDICGVSRKSTYIKIKFNDENVQSDVDNN
jgi:hypothetical protein